MNFDFLKDKSNFTQLYKFCKDAEEFVVSIPDHSAILQRKALEHSVKYFYVAKYGKYDVTNTLFNLIQDASFSSYIDPTLLSGVHLIRQVGNNAAHGESVTKTEALKSLEALYYFISELLKMFGLIASYTKFDTTIYTKSNIQPTRTTQEIEAISVDVQKEDIATLSQVSVSITAKSGTNFTEYETRRVYIDNALREAGWKVSTMDGAIKPNTACVEIKLDGMPNAQGVGYADYILFDDDNKPLAVVEAKKTSVDVIVGSQQAKLYADCIEAKWGVRPVIYYTNGYEIQMVDGVGYPPRRVFGYYSKDELHSLIVRRGLKQITDTRIDPTISDRPFIQLAATAVCDNFNSKHRKSLIVMATGTGKTRCAISIVDILQRANWAKHILFLADRNELVIQATNAFKKHLPNSTICALSEEKGEDRDMNARIIVSTYPTMLNLIDKERRAFGVGKFDLIILDECHRSVYNKYLAIIRYFDSLILGLTATPREQVDASTYELFEMPKGEPTFNYGFTQAVQEGYLVDYVNFDSTPALLKSGLKYDDLSDEEKKAYEEVFSDEEGNFPKEIDRKLFYKQIMNTGTIDAIIQTLMNDGLKVQSGEKLGKSIIFAYNHDHAQAIVDRFNLLYPDLAGQGFCKLIDYSVNYVSSLIADFKNPHQEPTIAVSVAMLDTGVDVPEILNLVFFKKVFSIIKFWQMIGRGTRVCKELYPFSPCEEFFENSDYTDDTKQVYRDKQGFYIFDCCENFPYFKENPKGKDGKTSLTLSQKIYSLKLDLVNELQRFEHQENEEHKEFYEKWKAEVYHTIKNFNRHHVNVNYNLKYVDKYSDIKAWDYIGILDLKELKKQIVPLIESEQGEERSKVFDLWVFNMELEELIGENDYSRAIQVVTTICCNLLDMTTIPDIAKKKEYLKTVVQNEFWQNINITKLEELRNEVRDLVKFLHMESFQPITTHFKDKVEPKRGDHLTPQFKNYKQRVIDYLAENIESPVIHKIRNIIPLNNADLKELERILWEELGSQEDYNHIASGESVAVFVRKIVGLDREAVSKIFAEYLSTYNFNVEQEEFLHQIVTFVYQNGDIEVANLINDEPFTYVDYNEIFQGQTAVVYALVQRLHSAIRVAA